MYIKPDISKKLNSSESINKIIRNTLRNGYLSVENACCILAVWDIFINHLERVYSGYDFERAKAFDEDGRAFKSDLSSKEGRYLLLCDLFGMWTRNNYWGGIRQADDDILKTYTLNNEIYIPEPDGKNGTLIKLYELKEFFDIHQLPLDIFSDASERSLVEKEAQTDRTNQSIIPYNGLGVERTKHCLKEWKASDGFIGLDIFIDGLTLYGYDETDIRRIYKRCGYVNWADIRKKSGWNQIAWNGIIYRLAFNIFTDKGIPTDQGDYGPLRVYKKNVLGFFYIWDSIHENREPEPAYVKLDDDLAEYFLCQFGIHIPAYNRMLNLWPLEPIQSLNKTDDAFWEKSWEIGFPDGYANDYMKGGDDWQEKALLAHKDGGAVRLFELAYILSKNNEWSMLLRGLWEVCGFNSNAARRDFPQWNDCFILDAETIERAWLWVLSRLAVEEKGTFVYTDPTNKIDVQIEHESYYFGRLSEQYPVGAYRIHLFRSTPIDEECRMIGFDMQRPDYFIGLDQFQRQILGLYQLCKTKFKDVDFPKPLIRIPDQENISALATEQATGPEPEIDQPKRRSAYYAEKQEEVQAMALTIWGEKQRRLPEGGKIKPEYTRLYADKRMKEICKRSDGTPHPPRTIEKWAGTAWKQFKKGTK